MTRGVSRLLITFVFAVTIIFAQPHPQPTEPKTTVIRFYAFVNEQTVSTLLNIIDGKVKTGTKRIVLLISSPGGSVFAGLSAYHYLKGIPVEVITHNFGTADSIATVMYCAGSKRYSVPQARFLMHGIAASFPAGVQLEEGNVDQQLKLMQQEVNAIASVIAENSKKTLTEVQGAISKRTVLTSEEAQKWGLVHEIRSQLYEEGADVVAIADSTPLNIHPISTGEITFSTNTATVHSPSLDLSSAQQQFFTVPLGMSAPSASLQSPMLNPWLSLPLPESRVITR
jgi:ATP-dependent protease ClpP protease subunit